MHTDATGDFLKGLLKKMKVDWYVGERGREMPAESPLIISDK